MEICPYRIKCMKLFIFDFGEVVLGNVDTFHPLSNLIGISYDELMADYSLYEMPLMDGYMSVEDYYRHLEMKYEMVINGNPFGELFCPTINTRMLDNVKELRAHGFRCVVGSNTFKPHWDIIKKMGVLENFDALYPSHEIHLSKPETAFFRYICSHEGVSFDETAFSDDRKENVEAAASLGISVLEYSGNDKDRKASEFFSKFYK